MKALIALFALFTFFTSCKKTESKKTESFSEFKQEKEFDSHLLDSLTQQLESDFFPNFHSLIIIDKGQIIFEEYFTGNDELHGKEIGEINHSINTLHDVRSISKSVVSTCIGIAINKGFIKNVNQNISEFFPEYSAIFVDEKLNWNIEHFLTMSTGMAWNEEVPYGNPLNDETKMRFSDNPTQYVLTRPIDTIPGKIFNYNGGATQVLLDIIERTSKLTMENFVKKYLFDSIEIKDFEWSSWEKSKIIAGPSGLRLTSRGLVNYALLYRNKGKWKNQQVIDSNWVSSSFKKQISYPSELLQGDEYYGYQFWIWDDTLENTKVNFVAAIGNGDQNIYWDLKSDLIVITTAGNYNNVDLENLSYEFLKDYIYKTLINNKE